MLLFIGGVCVAFGYVGRALAVDPENPTDYSFLVWVLGSILFGHATTFLSVSYFDQTIFLYYFVLASIGSLCALAPVPLFDVAKESQNDLEPAVEA